MAESAKLAAVFAAVALSSFASSITFDGPFGPGDTGVFGDTLIFGLQDATLTQPATPNGLWTLTIDTNYGTLLSGGGAGYSIPSYTLENVVYAMPDFLIQQGSNYYGIILGSHNGYTAGDLYSAGGFEDAPHFNVTRPAYLDPKGTLIGTGVVSAAPNPGANGTTVADYKITVSFDAPTTFLGLSDFTIAISSADCANGFVTAVGSFGNSGGSGIQSVPEPGTMVLTGTALLAACLFARRCCFQRN